jgi:multicomponent Na+:H+ antiporter subunit D
MSWFDREGIDWTIDGSARQIVRGGDRLRSLQTGRIQHYIGGAVAALLVVVLVAVLL